MDINEAPTEYEAELVARRESEKKSAHAVIDAVIELVAAARAAVDEDGGIRYEGDDDDIGSRACCGELSYKPHARDCWVPRLRAALAKFK